MRHRTSPEGTAEPIECDACVHIPIPVAEIQPSLRDAMSLFNIPTLERVGYSQISLRETTADVQPILIEEQKAEKRPSPSGLVGAKRGRAFSAWQAATVLYAVAYSAIEGHGPPNTV